MRKLEQELVELPAQDKKYYDETVAKDIATIVSGIIGATNTPVDNTVIEEIKKQLDLINTSEKPDNSEIFAAVMRQAQTLAQVTDSPVDDAIANVLSKFVEIFGGEQLFGKIRTFFINWRAKRKAKRDAKNGETESES